MRFNEKKCGVSTLNTDNNSMKKFTMILMAIVALTMTANAQWALQTNPLTGNNSLGKIQFVSATEGWIACGSNGSLLHTTNAGANWNIVTPFPGDVVGSMYDPATTMSWTNSTHGWALKTYIVGTGNITSSGNGAVLYSTTDGGSSWAKKEFPKTITTVTYSTADLHGTWQMHELVAANNTSYSSNTWAGWGHGTLTLDANGNGTFTGMTKSSDINDYPSSVSLSLTSNGILSVGGDTHGFMSTDKNTVYMTTTDGGGGYGLGVMQRVASGVTYTTSDLQGTWQIHQLVTANSASSNQYAGWIYGTIAIDSNGNGIASFIKPDGSKSQNIAVSISSDGTVLMNGTDFHGFMSADKKSICITMTDGGGYGYYLMAMQKVNPATSYATTDLQGKWQTHNLTTNSTSIFSLFNQSGWSHGTITLNANGEGNTNIISSNNNNSNNNNSNNNQSGDNISLSISSDGLVTTSGKDIHGFMSADKSSILITMTEDNGGYTLAVMQKDLSTSGDVGLQVQFADENNGWASIYNMIYGTYQVYKTTDGGTNWNAVNSTVGGFYQFLDGNNGWLIGHSGTIGNSGPGSEGNLYNIYHTTNGGLTWVQQAANIGTANALYFSDLLHGWVVGEGGLAMKTTDGGANWTTVTTTGQTSNSHSKTVYFLDANTGWIGSGEAKTDGVGTQFVLATKDGGATWETQATPVTNGIFSISFWNATNGWFTSDYGQIAHYTYTPPKTVNITAGGLSATLTVSEKSSLKSLTVTGTIDARDFKTMRDDMPLLAEINLSGAKIAAYTGTNGTQNSNNLSYPENTVPIKAFNAKSSLSTILLSSSAIALADSTFNDCTNLSSVNIPATVQNMGSYVFRNCSSLQTVTLPQGIPTIGDNAFAMCSKLSSITIPSSVDSIAGGAFWSCKSLTSIAIPTGVKAILGATFQYCANLQTITLPNTVTKLGAWSFQNSGLESVNIPASVVTLESGVFYNCPNLGSVTFDGSTLKTISDNAFGECKQLTSLLIPASVSSIGAYAFSDCIMLNSITVQRTTPVDLSASDGVFQYIDKYNCVLYVPSGSKSLYQTTVQWKDFSNIIEKYTKSINVSAGGLYAALTSIELNTVTDLNISGQIDARDFRTMRDLMPLLTNLDISAVSIAAHSGSDGPNDGYTTYAANAIPNHAFYVQSTNTGKTLLRTVLLPSTITKIEYTAFSSCGLTGINLPNGLTTIQDWAFNSCKLNTLFIPASVNSIGLCAFTWNKSLPSIQVASENLDFSAIDGVLFDRVKQTIVCYPNGRGGSVYQIPTGVTTIGQSALAGRGLQQVIIPSTVTTFSKYAFYSSEDLRTIDIPASVTFIGESAFNNCHDLTAITVHSSNPVNLSSSTDVFLNVNKTTCTLYVPVGSKALYQAAYQWKDFVNIVEGENSVTYNVTVPVGTKACYLVGEMNNWTQQVMTKVDDTHYTISLTTASSSQKYKYCSGPSWDYQEMDANGNYISDRSYSANDVVANWLAVFDPSTGIKELKGSDFSVSLYPNPVTDGFYIETGENTVLISVFNLNGALMLSKQVIDKDFINISSLSQGVYLVKIANENGLVVRKLVKK